VSLAADAPKAPAQSASAEVPVVREPLVQLSLFESEADPSDGKPHTGVNSKQLKVLEQLKTADLINMTPLQAINFIYDLQRKL